MEVWVEAAQPLASRVVYDIAMRYVAISLLLFCLPLCAQEKAQEKKEEAKQAAPAPSPTNLKVLKASTGPEVRQIMATFTAALGVQCTNCHVQGNYASDENPKKEVARKMIRMTQTINAQFPDAKMLVSCYTCHRGEAQPKNAPEPKAVGE
jgi:hypothetical protein